MGTTVFLVGLGGYGRFGGKAGIDSFTELRWITVETKPGQVTISFDQGQQCMTANRGCSFPIERVVARMLFGVIM